jgi:hypothetical protein
MMKSVVLLLVIVSATCHAQISDSAIEKAMAVTVMIDSTIDGSPNIGAGVIFGLANDQVYIATANHLVRRYPLEATDIKAEFRWLPGQPVPAKLLTNYDTALDLAVIVVEAPKAHMSPARFSLDLLDDPLLVSHGSEVWTIGNPSGHAYYATEGKIDQVEAINLKFRVAGLVGGGASGGPLVDRDGLIVGMVLQDAPPDGVATRIDLVASQLKVLGYPVSLRRGEASGLITDVVDSFSFQGYNPATQKLYGLKSNGKTEEVKNGSSLVSRGRLYNVNGISALPDMFYPYAMLDLTQVKPGDCTDCLLLLHPDMVDAAVLSLTVPITQTYDIEALFARANDIPNAGDGVRVIVCINQDFDSPIFDEQIRSDAKFVATDPYSSADAKRSHNTLALKAGDTIQFAVFSGAKRDRAYDVTALKVKISASGKSTILPRDFKE